MARKCALFGAIDVDPAWTFQTSVGATNRTITIAVAEYYPLDLLAAIQAGARVHAELATFGAALVGGKASLTLPAGCTVTWSTTALRDALRFTGATLAASAVGSEQMMGAFCPVAGAIEDRPRPVSNGSVVLGLTTADVHHYGTRNHRPLGVRFSGHQRSAAGDEWRAYFKLWLDYIGPGAVLRWYPDLTVSAAFNADSAPYGYHSLRVVAPREFDPAQVIPNHWGIWRHDLDTVEV